MCKVNLPKVDVNYVICCMSSILRTTPQLYITRYYEVCKSSLHVRVGKFQFAFSQIDFNLHFT